MVNIENHIGKIIISKKYLTELVEHAVTNCFGVSGVCSVSTFFIAFSALTGKNLDRNKGVEIYTDKNGKPYYQSSYKGNLWNKYQCCCKKCFSQGEIYC